jgi:hypothetical protein
MKATMDAADAAELESKSKMIREIITGIVQQHYNSDDLDIEEVLGVELAQLDGTLQAIARTIQKNG